MQETWVRSLSQEDPLEKGMVTHSSITWRISRTEERDRLQSMGSERAGPDYETNFHFSVFSNEYTFWKLMSEPDLLADGASCPPPPPAFFWIRIFAWLTGWSYRKNIVVSREHALVSRKLRKLHTAFHNVLISWTVLIKYNVYVHQIITLHTLNIQYRFFICPLYLTKARKKEKNTKNSVNWSQQKMFTVSKMYLP